MPPAVGCAAHRRPLRRQAGPVRQELRSVDLCSLLHESALDEARLAAIHLEERGRQARLPEPAAPAERVSVEVEQDERRAPPGLSAVTFFGLRPDGLMPRLMLLSPLLNPVHSVARRRCQGALLSGEWWEDMP